jgi:O-antigen ligase
VSNIGVRRPGAADATTASRRLCASSCAVSIASAGIGALLVGVGAAVPLLYRSRWSDVFAAPKLLALWAILAVSLGLLVIGLVADHGALLVGHLREASIRARVVFIAVIAWVVGNLSAFAFSSDHRLSLFGEHYWYQGLLTHLLYAGFFLVAYAAISERSRLWWLVGGVTAGGFFVASIGLMQAAGSDLVFGIEPPGGRVFSTIGQSNALAAYLIVTIMVAATFLVRLPPAWRLLALLAIGVMVACLLMTESRGGYLGLAIATVVAITGLVALNRVSPIRVVAALLALAVLLAVAHTSIGPVRDRLDAAWERTAASTDTAADVSTGIHLDLWHEAWRITMDHALVGTGQDTFPVVFPQYAQDLGEQRATELAHYRMESPHNVYLSIASGAGVPVLAAYLTLVGAFAAAAVSAARRTQDASTKVLYVFLVAAVAGHLVTDLFMTADLVTTTIVWLLMGGALGALTARSEIAAPSLATSNSE